MNQEIYQLFRKYQQNKCGREDALRVLDLVEQGEFQAEWEAALDADETEVLLLDESVSGMTSAESEALRMRILRSAQATRRKERNVKVHRLRYIRYAAAAVLLIGLAFSGYFWLFQSDDRADTIYGIVPGGHRATLALTDGRVVLLSESQEGIVVTKDMLMYGDGTEILESLGSPALSVPLMTLSTPKGGTYQATLSDGSRVWLNAGSTLKYPSRFGDAERIVELEGEAFFEIKEQKIKAQGQANAMGDLSIKHKDDVLSAFKVVTKDQTVEVLGTQFNISAYADEPEIKTTLVEGSVKISNLTSHDMRILNPNEQAIVHGPQVEIRKIDVTSYVAWKNGLFDFNTLSLEEAMRQIARWYDIEVVYENGIPDNVVLRGKMERDLSFQTVLEILQRLNLDYRMEAERRLVVLNNKNR
ncbi:FecR family protein [Parapedobacter tibetensis]|uniref:FecR family protein n=1 Tax=Parapedobacter tibetensis TaxID=2972951 RepID=UPI00214D3890|nr:FecR family protein [Parapedobacter tibetensis]